MSKAINEKTEEYAYRTANFARGTFNDNPTAGNKAFNQHMLNYYRETNDTAKYLINAVPYYEKYYMSVSVDSVKRFDSLSRAQLKPQNFIAVDTIINGRRVNRMSTTTYAPRTQFYTQELNKGARSFYTMTNDRDKLLIAKSWIEKGLQFFETAEALDTYARILFKLNEKQKAIEVLNKAIALKKERGGFPTKDLEDVLTKMKGNASVIE